VRLPSSPEETVFEEFGCSLDPGGSPGWSSALIAGCPGTVFNVLDRIQDNKLEDIFRYAGFFDQPDLTLPQAKANSLTELDVEKTITGTGGIKVSPLQMVLAASAVSSNGVRPAPRIAVAVNTPAQGWVILPSGQSSQVFSTNGINNVGNLLNDGESPFWHTTSTIPTNEGKIHWFVGGTLPDWLGTPLALVIVTEEGSAEAATEAGLFLLRSVLEQ
jgi:hypothetical protein